MAGLQNHETETLLADDATCGLGDLRIQHPPGIFPVTPASLVSLRAIGTHQHLLSGTGLDWGAGSGVLAIAAARIAAVTSVCGLEILEANVEAARENARVNGAAAKTRFIPSISFSALDPEDQAAVDRLKGRVQFILANPPSSPGDDGFEFRRRILRDSRVFLAEAGLVFLSISTQYGRQRIANLTSDAPGFAHGGVLASSERVPFDLNRPDLLDCLHAYVEEERRGGLPYEFTLTGRPEHELVTAAAALADYQRTGTSPLSKWQTHLFQFRPATGTR